MKKRKIGIWGFGNMGQAIFQALKKDEGLKRELDFYINSLDVKKVLGARCVDSPEELFRKSDLVLICIKPQDFFAFDGDKIDKTDLILVSIMAGVSLRSMEKKLGTTRVVRTMPNLNLQVGSGVTGWYAKENVFKNKWDKEQLKLIEKIFNSCGVAIRVKREKMLNGVTAISGSGPAYVFLFINALIKGARELGFSRAEAEKLVLGTVEGSLLNLQARNNFDLDKLIGQVKSKGGTTEAALNKINKSDSFYRNWKQALKQARKRAEELSGDKK